jgi:diacylglycerol kinase family enzyme
MDAGGHALTTAVALRRAEVIINPLSGSVGPTAVDDMRGILDRFELEANVQACEPGNLDVAMDEAVKRKPDLLVILAGDGTARAACLLSGVTGPLVAPLPGGTMNILPKALYGDRDWKTALSDTLANGVVREVGGGSVGGHRFYAGAMIGNAALFAPAREAARERQVTKALSRAYRAYGRAFASYVYFELDGNDMGRARAMNLICPLISKELSEDERSLEVAALNPQNPREAIRIGARVLLSRVLGDWRDDPAVDLGRCREGVVWGRNPLPALVDGEPVRLGRRAEIKYHPKAFRALAPAEEDPAKI